MGGSFESGAGDDPNDLFADDDTDDEEATREVDVQSEQADKMEAVGQDIAAPAPEESEAEETSTESTGEEDAPSDSGSPADLMQLALLVNSSPSPTISPMLGHSDVMG